MILRARFETGCISRAGSWSYPRTRRPPAIGGTLGRIVMLQAATIIGGMFARTYGDMAPWLILIGLKTLFDYQRPDRRSAAHR
jgi:hypothetical protein